MSTRTEKIYVLYGSQTGNSEQAGKDFCDQLSENLGPAQIQAFAKTRDTIKLEPVHMQLDDFLEVDHCQWTRLVVIYCSSYGVGQAPLGGYRFRELCDAWKESGETSILTGVHFALCGLGDSKYPTFFVNPTHLYQGLTSVGAKLVGQIGKADASGTGDQVQAKVIERWTSNIWKDLAQVVATEPPSDEELERMQAKTVALCRKINPDFMPETKSNGNLMVILAVLVALLAVAVYVMMQRATHKA